MYQYQLTNNPAGSNDEWITVKAPAIESLYVQGPNPTEPADYSGSYTTA
jgi:hypothetical protein